MLRINNIKIKKNISEEQLINQIIKKYHIKNSDIIKWNIIKKSIDARKKNDISFNYTVDIEVKDESKYPNIKKIEIIDIDKKIINLKKIDGLFDI